MHTLEQIHNREAPRINTQGNVQKSPSSKAAALLTRGAYPSYVSTAKGRERRWRLFSTFPSWPGWLTVTMLGVATLFVGFAAVWDILQPLIFEYMKHST